LKETEAKRRKTYKCKYCPVVIDADLSSSPPDFDEVKAERAKQKAKTQAKPKPGTYKPSMLDEFMAKFRFNLLELAKKPPTQNNLITSYFNPNNTVPSKEEEKPFQPPLRFRPCKRVVQSNLITSYFQSHK
jgi:hypothetical protein